MNRELKHAMTESDKKASDLACAQRTLKTLENLENSRKDAVARASHHLVVQDLRVLHEMVTKAFSVPGAVAARRVGIPIGSEGLISVRKCQKKSS
jgi:hypothetical protein